MSLFQKPRISKLGKITQTSYELPHRVFCTKVYPIKARNGSTIILYGHSNGLRIVWKGGNPLKRAVPAVDGKASALTEEEKPKDEVSSPDTNVEDQSDNLEPQRWNNDVIQDLDLPLGTETLDIALTPLSSQRRAGVPTPNILGRNMVLAVACGDSSVRVLSIPLEAPSVETKEKLSRLPPEKYASIAQLPAGPKAHDSPPAHVALSWTVRDTAQSIEPHSDHPLEWDLLLASAGSGPSSTLLLTRIPFARENGRDVLKSNLHSPSQKLNLSSQAVSIAFNTATYPSRRHSQLLIAERNGKVHVYDPLGTFSYQSRADGDGDSTMSLTAASKGTWITSFTTPYQSQYSAVADLVSPALARPKLLLAAQWALQGRSAIVLTSDGEFGLWDVDGNSPNALKLRNSLASRVSDNNSDSASRGLRSGLAPMTPNTRAAKAQRLFSSPTPTTSTPAAPRGGLSVLMRGINEPSESVVLWYGNDVHSIPNLQSFSQRSEGPTRSTGSLYGSGISRVEGLNLRGELISSVAQLPFADNSRDSHSHSDFLVSTDSRINVLDRHTGSLPFGDSSALVRQEDDEEMEDEEEERADMELLGREELGIAGIEKLANNMSGSRLFGRSGGRKVLFASS